MKNPLKKTKKNQIQKQDPKQQLAYKLLKVSRMFTEHAVVVMFIIGGLTVGVALLRARSYLNPARDENRYQEAASKNTYSKIDYKLVKKLQDSLTSAKISVSQAVDPNRKNPFSE